MIDLSVGAGLAWCILYRIEVNNLYGAGLAWCILYRIEVNNLYGAGLAWCILYRIEVTHCWKHLPSIALEQLLPTSQRRTIHSDIVLANTIGVRGLSIYLLTI